MPDNKTPPKPTSFASESRIPPTAVISSEAETSADTISSAETITSSDSGVWRLTSRRGILKQRSIRSKLLFGILTLSTMVLLLASVGILGLYRYRGLADAISSRATELPMATQINQAAARARESNSRICQMKASEGMIDSFEMLSEGDLTFEKSAMVAALNELDYALARYTDMVSSKVNDPHQSEISSALIDPRTQLASLEEINRTVERIDQMRRDIRCVAIYNQSNQNELEIPLNDLVDQTSEHMALLHGQLAAFSDHVKNIHRVGITIAWGAFVVTLLTTAVMVWFFQTMVIEPFRNLVVGARLVARGQFEHRIDLGTGDEVGELGLILNQMTDRFQQSLAHIEKMCDELDQEVQVRSQEVIRNEQLAGVGFLAAGFAHEINNPMAAIAWSAEAMESRMNDLMMMPDSERLLDAEMTANWTENLQRIEGEAFRCKAIIEKMLLFSRMGQVEKTPTDLIPLVQDVIDMVGTLGKYKCDALRLHADETAIAYANPQEIRQVVLNLVTNALECVDSDGRVDVFVRQDGQTTTIRVRDTGCGMTPEVLTHLFEPFFTRRRDGTGTGLGLSISHRIVCQHGGQLIARSEGENRGSEFELRLPVTAITQEETSPVYESWKFRDAQQTQAA